MAIYAAGVPSITAGMFPFFGSLAEAAFSIEAQRNPATLAKLILTGGD
jgi:hypothetical protein